MLWLTADKTHAQPREQNTGSHSDRPRPQLWNKTGSHLGQDSDHKFGPKRDLTLVKNLPPALIQSGLSFWSKVWPQVWSETGPRFGQNSDPKFDPTWDLIFIKIQTPSSVQNRTPFWSKFWPQFDTTWDLGLIKIRTPVCDQSGIRFLNNVGLCFRRHSENRPFNSIYLSRCF